MASVRKAGVLLGRSERAAPSAEETTIWAIRNVSFEVSFGTALGIIGHNGAGKSTLVKVLSRITEPTEGRAVISGRVGSLLEVSAGFHPELTGRENVYLNGAVLGMSRMDIRKRFDEIVEFAQVERYLDTPVKYYSSGMSMRLAFAVAAHLEPEVLVVDEVLAVGDTGFHKRCLDKMTQAVSEGRCVLFISHNLGAVTQLCTKGLLLQRGQVVGEGTSAEVVSMYLANGKAAAGRAIIDALEGEGSRDIRFTALSVGPTGGEASTQVDRDEGAEVTIEYEVRRPVRNCQINLELWNYEGICVLSSGILDSGRDGRPAEVPGAHVATCRIPSQFFRGGLYSVSVEASVADVGVIDQAANAITFEVVDLSSPDVKLLESSNGALRPMLEWTDESLNNRTASEWTSLAG